MGKINLYNSRGKLLYKANTDREIDRGGEGTILPHPANNHLVLKIYHMGIIPALSPQSWVYLSHLGNHFVKPLELLYNDKGEVVGFEMQYPDKIINRQLSWNKTPAWGKGLKFESSPIQQTGGIERTHYRLGESVNTVTLPMHIKTIRSWGSVGIITYIDQETLKHHWFRINGLRLTVEKELAEPTDFATKQMGQTTMVFVPQDGRIEVLRANDFETVDTILVPVATAQSQIYMTDAGLLLYENKTLYLINRK